jgi:microcin C transport system permease protein
MAPTGTPPRAIRPARRAQAQRHQPAALAAVQGQRRGFHSTWIFLVLFVFSLFAEFIANDRPIMASYKGELLFPIFADYPETKFGGFLAQTDFRDPFIQEESQRARLGDVAADPLRLPCRQLRTAEPRALAPGLHDELGRGVRALHGRRRRHQLHRGQPQLARHRRPGPRRHRPADLRLPHFGAVRAHLDLLSSIIGVAAGAVQGYFGGWTDLLFQRVIEIWNSIPTLYLLIILAAFLVPSFWLLLGIMLLFSWTALVGVVRAEFLRGRNFEYIRAARALGLSDAKIMFKHLLPNAMVATLTFMPFIVSGSVTTLTALDFLGFGLPPGSASLGELLAQGKANLQAPWLGLTAFAVVSVMLSLLVFIGEAVRDAFDPRKTFR